MKTSELTGATLDWAVAKCEGSATFGWTAEGTERTALLCVDETWQKFKPSTDWAKGGPIIEREGIAIDFDGEAWTASDNEYPICHRASTPLIAAMRCYVTSKMGDEVEIPEELAA